jgi:hypothetical protein
MEEEDEIERFAFGANVTDEGCDCPAVVAGMNPEDNKQRADVVKEYDSIMFERTGVGVGEVPAKEAKNAWNKAIRVMKGIDDERSAEYGEEIADELDW